MLFTCLRKSFKINVLVRVSTVIRASGRVLFKPDRLVASSVISARLIRTTSVTRSCIFFSLFLSVTARSFFAIRAPSSAARTVLVTIRIILFPKHSRPRPLLVRIIFIASFQATSFILTFTNPFTSGEIITFKSLISANILKRLRTSVF